MKQLARNLEQKDPNLFLNKASAAASSSVEGDAVNSLPFGLTSTAILACDATCARKKKKAEEAAKGRWARGGVNAGDDDDDDPLPPAFEPPEYSDWLKQFASSNLLFANDVEKVFFELVDKVRGFNNRPAKVLKASNFFFVKIH